jgi:hypothetical protein
VLLITKSINPSLRRIRQTFTDTSIITSGFISDSVFELSVWNEHTYILSSQPASEFYANDVWASSLSNECLEYESPTIASSAHAASSTIINSYTAWSASLSIWRHASQHTSESLECTVTVQHSSTSNPDPCADPK